MFAPAARLTRRLALAGVLALAAAAAAAQTPVSDTIVSNQDLVGRITAPVYINGEGPFDFIVDTGANRSALSRELSERLALPSAGQGQVHAFTGVFSAQLAHVDLLVSGAVTLERAALPVIESRMLADADGLLGVEALSGRRLIFDFVNERITIEQASSQLRGANWHDIRADRRFGNLIVARGEIGRVPVHMIIDTGANQSFANTALRDALRGGGARAEAVTGTRLTAAGSNPIVLDEALFIPIVDFGETELRNVVAYVGDLYIFEIWDLADTPTLVIGMDLLTRIDAVAIDYRRGLIQFRSRRGLTRR